MGKTVVWHAHQADAFSAGSNGFYVGREKTTTKYEYRGFDSWTGYACLLAADMKKKNTSHYHELVRMSRRLHFDLDYKESKDTVFHKTLILNALLNGCKAVLATQGINLEPESVWVLDSSRELDSKTYKHSLHVIISNVYTATPEESHEFMNEVRRKMVDVLPVDSIDSMGAIDKGIYQKNRLFRTAFSSKRERSDVILRPVSFEWNGKTHEHTLPEGQKEMIEYVLKHTLLTVIDGCVQIEYPHVVKSSVGIMDKLTSEEAILATSLARSYFTESEFQFNVEEGRDRSIKLIRKGPSPCRICKVIHQRDNAELFVSEQGNVLYRCWRADSKLLIGRVGDSNTTSIIVSDGGVSTSYMNIDTTSDGVRISTDFIRILLKDYGYIVKGLDPK